MPARKQQTNTRRDLVSQEILDKAVALFTEKGFANTSLQDVANSLQISRTALYHYIGSKEELLAALVRGLTQETAESLERIANDESLDPIERLEAALRDMTSRIARDPDRFRLLAISEHDLPEPIFSQHRDAQRRTLRALTAVVSSGMAAGRLRTMDPDVAAFGLLGTCNWVAWWYNPGHPGALTRAQLVDELTSLGVAALRTPKTRIPTGDAGVEHAMNLLRQDLDYLGRSLAGARGGSTQGATGRRRRG